MAKTTLFASTNKTLKLQAKECAASTIDAHLASGCGEAAYYYRFGACLSGAVAYRSFAAVLCLNARPPHGDPASGGIARFPPQGVSFPLVWLKEKAYAISCSEQSLRLNSLNCALPNAGAALFENAAKGRFSA
jgi:hypothetical protein